MIKTPAIRYILPFLLIAFFGCTQTAPDEPLALTDPIKNLIRICDEEHHFTVIVTPFDHAVWVYLPLEESFLHMKADSKGSSNSSVSTVNPVIKYLDGIYQDGNFHLTYDIAPSKGYAKSYGYTSEFSEDYKSKQRNLLTAIYRAFNEVSDPPEFFVVILADIINGLESRTFIHYEDLKRAYIDPSFHEEYAKRIISEQPLGNAEMIGDRTGESIHKNDITWPEFLSKQMIFRVNFKYQRSAFPPSNDTQAELLNIAADTVSAYDFTNFTSIELHDLNNNTNFSITREDLVGYRSESPSEGRLIHIKFE